MRYTPARAGRRGVASVTQYGKDEQQELGACRARARLANRTVAAQLHRAGSRARLGDNIGDPLYAYDATPGRSDRRPATRGKQRPPLDSCASASGAASARSGGPVRACDAVAAERLTQGTISGRLQSREWDPPARLTLTSAFVWRSDRPRRPTPDESCIAIPIASVMAQLAIAFVKSSRGPPPSTLQTGRLHERPARIGRDQARAAEPSAVTARG